jgi:hypothetical protein
MVVLNEEKCSSTTGIFNLTRNLITFLVEGLIDNNALTIISTSSLHESFS